MYEVQQDLNKNFQDTPLPLESDTGTLTGSETGSKSTKSMKKKYKPVFQAKRRSGPTIASQLREVPDNLEEITEVPASQLGATALEWLINMDDINIIRLGTSINGVISSHIKRRINVLGEVIKVLAEKVEDVGDPGFLRRRNAELTAELKVAKR